MTDVDELSATAWRNTLVGGIVSIVGFFPSLGIVIRSFALIMIQAFHGNQSMQNQGTGLINWLMFRFPPIDLRAGFTIANVVSAFVVLVTFVGICLLFAGLWGFQELRNASDRVRQERLDAAMRKRKP